MAKSDEFNSGYERLPDDLYVTPAWVYQALWRVEPWAALAWDCAPVERGSFDFLKTDSLLGQNIATNPPFVLSERFVRHAIGLLEASLLEPLSAAFLLPHAWDTAKGRVDLFRHPYFKAKYAITTRIRWDNLVQKEANPKRNHSWFVWNNYSPAGPRMGWL